MLAASKESVACDRVRGGGFGSLPSRPLTAVTTFRRLDSTNSSKLPNTARPPHATLALDPARERESDPVGMDLQGPDVEDDGYRSHGGAGARLRQHEMRVGAPSVKL